MIDSIVPSDGSSKLVSVFLNGRKAHTLRAYQQHLEDFASHLGESSISAAAHRLLSSSAGDANALVLEYQQALLEKGLTPSTINSRLAAVRSLVKLARMLGLVAWSLEIPNLRQRSYRDTRGPGKEGVKKMLATLGSSPKGRRDAAIIHLLFDRGLRRGEVAALDLSDLEGGRVRIIGKGHREPEWLTLPQATQDALAAWIAHRGPEAGPLFFNLDRVMAKGRLSDHAIYEIVVKTAKRAGLGHTRPHGLRHAAITHALDRTNGNVRAAARFARHARIDTTLRYDDNRLDLGGAVADLIAQD